MGRLARDGTVEPNSRDKIIIRVRGQLIMSRIDKRVPPVDAQSAENDYHTNIHIHTHIIVRLMARVEAVWV